MLRHALREDVPPNAVAGAPAPELLAGMGTSAQGMAKLREAVDAAKAGKRWQKSVKPVLDVLVTFSRDDAARLDRDDQDAYFRRALEFVQERFGGAENMLTATVHRDESTAHVQILMLARERGGVKLGASQFMGNRGNLHRLQNAFWETCGKPFGMQRGEPYTGIKNLPVRQLYGALAAGAEVPRLMEVPEVSLSDKLLRPERMTQRDRAIQHNQAAVEELRAQAQRGKGLHPKLIERQAERYRQAATQADDAEQQAEKALQRAAEARRQLQVTEDCLAILDKRLEVKLTQERQLDASIDRLRKMEQAIEQATQNGAAVIERYRRAAAQADEAEKALQQAAEARRQTKEAEAYLASLDKRLEAKQAQERQLDASIDRLREMRDRERGHDLDG